MKKTPPRLRETLAVKNEEKARSRKRLLIGINLLLLLVVLLLGYGLLERTLLRPHVDATVERSDLFIKAGEHIQVNVINACGANGIAQKFTEFLRARKFDVPEYGTATTQEPVTRIIDRIGDPTSARKVAYALGVDPKNIETEIDTTLFLSATVLIGHDYAKLRPMK